MQSKSSSHMVLVQGCRPRFFCLHRHSEAFLSILDKYTAVGIYLIHHTFTMAELFAMSSFYITSTTLQAGIAAADESVRTIDGIFGSNETSRALASFITLVRDEFNQDSRYMDKGRLSIIASLTKAITAFAVLQNSTFKRSAKGMKMRVVYDCTVLGEVDAKSWRSMIVGSGNFIKSRNLPEQQLLPSNIPTRTSSSHPSQSPTLRHLEPAALLSGRDSNERYTSLPSRRSRSTFGDALCLTDIGLGYNTPGWSSSIGPSSPTETWDRSNSQGIPDNRSILADLDFLVGAEEDGDPVDDTVATVKRDDLPKELRRRLGQFDESELRDGVMVVEPGNAKDANPKEIRRFVRRLPGRGKHETVYEITTETIETTETITTVQEQAHRRKAHTRTSSRDGTLRIPKRRGGGSTITERDITSTRSGFETESIFEGGKETTLEEEDEWCEIARTTNEPGLRSVSMGSDVDHLHSEEAPMEIEDLDEEIPEVPNGKPMALVKRSGHDVATNNTDSSSKMQVVLKTMTKKLVQKRRTIRKIEIRSDPEDDALPDRIEAGSMDLANHDHLSVTDRRGGHGESRRHVKTAPSSPKNMFHGFQGSRNRQTSPPARPEITQAHARNGEMSNGLQKVFKMAKNSLKNTSHQSGLKPYRKSLPASPDYSPESEKVAHHPEPPAITLDEPQTPTQGKKVKGSRHQSPPNSKSKGYLGAAASKRTASPFEGDSAKVAKHPGTTSPKKRSDGRSVGKDLPQIPSRGESNRLSQLWSDPNEDSKHSGVPFPAPSSPYGTVRESKRRSRAPSITSIHSFASRAHLQSTTKGPESSDAHTVEAGAFPKAHLVQNLYRFMRYSSAAYGQNFMRILGIGSLDYFFPDTTKHNANVWAFAHHVGIPVDAILLNSFSEPQPLSSERMSPLVNYVAIDDESKAVVLTCRGTLGLSDILTDLTCTYEDIEVLGGKQHDHYQVHSGMLASAKRLSSERGTVMYTIRQALDANPDYGLVVTGHSLGGGVAALLAILLGCPSDVFQTQMLEHRTTMGIFAPHVKHPKIFTPFVTAIGCGLPPGRPIHAYAYGVPAVSSPDLSKYSKGLVTSVVHGHDFVPTLSLGMVRDMKNISHALSAEKDSDVAQDIIAKVIGLYQKRKNARSILPASPAAGLLVDGFARPQEAPLQERQVTLEPEEMKEGRTRNRAKDSGYQDPGLVDSDDPFSYAPGGGIDRGNVPHSYGGAASDPDVDLHDWLWSLIKTIRADMTEAKLYPPGEVYCKFNSLRILQVLITNISGSDRHRIVPRLRYAAHAGSHSRRRGKRRSWRSATRHPPLLRRRREALLGTDICQIDAARPHSHQL